MIIFKFMCQLTSSNEKSNRLFIDNYQCFRFLRRNRIDLHICRNRLSSLRLWLIKCFIFSFCLVTLFRAKFLFTFMMYILGCSILQQVYVLIASWIIRLYFPIFYLLSKSYWLHVSETSFSIFRPNSYL